MTGWTAVRDALLALAVAPFAYYALAIYSAGRFFGGKPAVPAGAPSNFTPPVSILKPIRGLDRETYENYASFCRQNYREFEILFCVTDEQEPAVPVIRKLIADFPERPIRLLVGAEPLGASDKVNKLCRMVREARHDILIVSDSDVRVDAGFLRAVVAPFSDAGVGGVTCLYRGLAERCFAAGLEALGNSTDFAPGVLVAWLLGRRRLNFMLGAVMVTTKKLLAEIGGFESLVDYFCDDYELGNRIAARGYQVELSPFPVDIVYPRESLADAFRHQIRWNLSIRYSRPWGHVGLIFTHGLVWSLAGAVLAHSELAAWGYVAGYSLLRYEAALATGARGMRDRLVRQKLWMLPLRDAFAFVVWLASFFPQRIYWRDREFRVRQKRLVPVPAPRRS
ncbi:MAG TPA: bacteriohopanetetrol glucosamine biosynthesis glycosyltransferase HpnI [Candidatus Acidoferrales bacterium]|nr:bacteriohopanetetrol glucosamine biosynthesis glycosyltransferase HpnI [Candidatus Acidoferrales bacterium]